MEPWTKSALYSFVCFSIAALIILSANSLVMVLPWHSMEEETTVKTSGEVLYNNDSAVNAGPMYVWDREGRRVTGDIIIDPSGNETRTYDEDRELAAAQGRSGSFSESREDACLTGYYITIVLAVFALLTFLVILLVGAGKLVREIGNIFTYILIIMTLVAPVYTLLMADGVAFNNPAEFLYHTEKTSETSADGYYDTTIVTRNYASVGFYFHLLGTAASVLSAMALGMQYTGVRFTQHNLDTIFNKDGTLKDLSKRGKRKKRRAAYKEYNKPMGFTTFSFVLILLMLVSAITGFILVPVQSHKESSRTGEAEVYEYRSFGMTGEWKDEPDENLNSPGVIETIRVADKENYMAYDDFVKPGPGFVSDDPDLDVNDTDLVVQFDTESGEWRIQSEKRIQAYTYSLYLTIASFVTSLMAVILLSMHRNGRGNVTVTKVIILVAALLAIAAPVLIVLMEPEYGGAEFFYYETSRPVGDTGVERVSTHFASLGWYMLLTAGIMNLYGFISTLTISGRKKKFVNPQGEKVTKDVISRKNVDVREVMAGVHGEQKRRGGKERGGARGVSVPSHIPSDASPGVPSEAYPHVLPDAPSHAGPVQPTHSRVQTGPTVPVHPQATPAKATKVQCPTCGTPINVQHSGKPVEIVCPACGTRGVVE